MSLDGLARDAYRKGLLSGRKKREELEEYNEILTAYNKELEEKLKYVEEERRVAEESLRMFKEQIRGTIKENQKLKREVDVFLHKRGARRKL